jgi:hypothetical protein
MLSRLSDKVRHCREHAEECKRLAEGARDPAIAEQYLAIKQRWLALARSLQTSERVSAFIDSQDPANEPSREPSLAGKRFAADLAARLSSAGVPATVVHPEALSDFVRRQAEQVMEAAQNCKFPDVRAELQDMARSVLSELGAVQWCAGCGATMQVVAVAPRVAGHDELRTYRCERCGVVETRPVLGEQI